VDLLALLKPIFKLFGPPLLVTFPATLLLWFMLDKPVPEIFLPPIAMLLTPSLWLGLFLAVLLTRYFRSVGKATESTGTAARQSKLSVKALKRLDRAYRAREVFARTKLRHAVYIGYYLKYVQMGARLTGHPLNAYRGNTEERMEGNRRTNQALFCKLCEFVFVAGTADAGAARKTLDEFIALLPDRSSKSLITKVLLSTFDDGAGFLSTLTALTYAHYVISLPLHLGDKLDSVLSGITFDTTSFGWLGNRVFEATIYLCIHETSTTSDVCNKVQPVLDDITNGIATSSNSDELLQAKWRGRGLLRQAASIRSRT
jgi:hypothetical protein